ncbi:hypothetical protein [Actinoplanes sp. NPDC049316]|uniref:hypothetical protein n=1 Tax=Actinoplanes sp. NPDC049316 TaxID=3154727 RepID=UPI003416EC6D
MPVSGCQYRNRGNDKSSRRIMTDTLNPGSASAPISQVVEGMRVLDAAGTEVGKVELVKLGDPEAITTAGEETDNGEPRVAGEIRARLLRLGFIKVDRKGFLKPDGYVAADEIDRVQDGAVHLTVTDKDMLTKADG